MKNIFSFNWGLIAKTSWKFITRDSLWGKLLTKKYIALGFRLDQATSKFLTGGLESMEGAYEGFS